MAASHWDAFLKTPSVLMKDWQSIVFHGVLSKIEDSVDNYAAQAFPGNMLIQFIMNGFSYTLRQDYLLALTGQEGSIPDSATMGISLRTNY